MDRREGRRHKQQDKHMDRYIGTGSKHYPIRLLKAIQARKKGGRKKGEREKTETESADRKKDRQKHQSTAGEREEIRATESSTKKNTPVMNWINFQDRVDNVK